MCQTMVEAAKSPITRRLVVLKGGQTVRSEEIKANECNVLLINATYSMAKEITHELAVSLPGCSITYTPTIELARIILRDRKIDLIISDAILADGTVSKLSPMLQQCDPQPDLLVVGAPQSDLERELHYAKYRKRQLGKEKIKPYPIIQRGKNTSLAHANTQAIQQQDSHYRPTTAEPKHLAKLGADIRNDLNNPLQEIVTMVFVAQSGSEKEIDPTTATALGAIDKAANNMASVIHQIEERIRLALK